ncbi:MULTISPECIES: hypothetical protein [unclassified Thioalkalivibrio]|uniref:hypothetical protein n=1 Tax=unclassified Thioalkalivibrio TaxID=2621013 RepID=UPI000368C1B8|nr:MULTISPECIES: hypothetical protein [unclassified Thioalkalivibrio]
MSDHTDTEGPRQYADDEIISGLPTIADVLGVSVDWVVRHKHELPCRQIGGKTFTTPGALRVWMMTPNTAPKVLPATQEDRSRRRPKNRKHPAHIEAAIEAVRLAGRGA